MSDEPLPGDEPREVLDVEDLTEDEATSIDHSADVVDLLDSTLKQIEGKPPKDSYNGGFILLVNEHQGGNNFIFKITENVSLTYLVGCLEVTKQDILRMIEEEHMYKEELEEDESPAS